MLISKKTDIIITICVLRNNKNMNSISQNMLSQYSPTTKEEKYNALHIVKPLTRFCVKGGKLFSIDMKILTDYQRFLPVRAFVSIERTNNTICDLPVRAFMSIEYAMQQKHVRRTFISIERMNNITIIPRRGFIN